MNPTQSDKNFAEIIWDWCTNPSSEPRKTRRESDFITIASKAISSAHKEEREAAEFLCFELETIRLSHHHKEEHSRNFDTAKVGLTDNPRTCGDYFCKRYTERIEAYRKATREAE